MKRIVESSTALDCTITSTINYTDRIFFFFSFLYMKKLWPEKKRKLTYNYFKCSTIFLITRKSINKKFFIASFLYSSLKKLYGDLRRNNLPFFDHVLNHRANKRNKMVESADIIYNASGKVGTMYNAVKRETVRFTR